MRRIGALLSIAVLLVLVVVPIDVFAIDSTTWDLGNVPDQLQYVLDNTPMDVDSSYVIELMPPDSDYGSAGKVYIYLTWVSPQYLLDLSNGTIGGTSVNLDTISGDANIHRETYRFDAYDSDVPGYSTSSDFSSLTYYFNRDNAQYLLDSYNWDTVTNQSYWFNQSYMDGFTPIVYDDSVIQHYNSLDGTSISLSVSGVDTDITSLSVTARQYVDDNVTGEQTMNVGYTGYVSGGWFFDTLDGYDSTLNTYFMVEHYDGLEMVNSQSYNTFGYEIWDEVLTGLSQTSNEFSMSYGMSTFTITGNYRSQDDLIIRFYDKVSDDISDDITWWNTITGDAITGVSLIKDVPVTYGYPITPEWQKEYWIQISSLVNGVEFPEYHTSFQYGVTESTPNQGTGNPVLDDLDMELADAIEGITAVKDNAGTGLQFMASIFSMLPYPINVFLLAILSGAFLVLIYSFALTILGR